MKGTIVYYGNFELPDKGASAHRVVNNGKIFQALGYRVVFLGTNQTADFFEGVKQTSFDKDMFEECYPNSTKRWVRYVFDAANIEQLVGMLEDVKLIIAYNLPYYKCNNIKKLSNRLGISAAYDCTEWNGYAEGNFAKRLFKKIDLFQIKHFLASKADGMIVISKTMEQYYRNKHIIRIPPLVDIEDAIWHQKIEGEKEKFEFCYAGDLGVKEALDKVIAAFDNLHNENAILRIIGLHKQDVCDMFPELTAVSKNKNILFMGRLSHEETVKYVRNCDCYVFLRYNNPRNHAGFPTKFAEAYTCGVPVITTNVSDIAEYMKSTDNGVLLEDIQEAEITGAMRNIIGEKIDNKELRKDFDYRKHIKKTEKWLSVILPEGEVG